MVAYYSEHDPFAAQWLRNLIMAGMIAPGDVDERDIQDVIPVELHKYTQCHFFAGIGGWSYSMRRAGWPDNRRAWTGSCPCQPFSQAGERAGFADERHLWPAFYHLIEQCGPDIVFGEQVASPDGLAWIDLVQSDMEATNYTFGALDTCAAGYGAPHVRQRLYWMAYYYGARSQGRSRVFKRRDQCVAWPYGVVDGVAYDTSGGRGEQRRAAFPWEVRYPDGSSDILNRVADPTEPGWFPWGRTGNASNGGDTSRLQPRQLCNADWLVHANGGNASAEREQRSGQYGQLPPYASLGNSDCRPGPVNGAWDAVDWLRCKDARWRPVEPGTFPLVNGAPNRVGLLRGYGNAIVAPQAEEFIRAAMEYAP